MTKASTIEELAIATTNDPRWVSLVGRDASADGKFYYSVKTTGGVLLSVMRSSPWAARGCPVSFDMQRR